MAVWKVALSLLKKQKAYGVTILLLSLVVVLMLSAALTVIKRGGELYLQAYDRTGCPDVMFLAGDGGYNTEAVSQLEAMDEVESVDEISVFAAQKGDFIIDGNEAGDWVYLFPHQPELNTYQMKPTQEEGYTLPKGEILMPLLYGSYYGIQPGDTVLLYEREFTVAAFFEDPVFGSPLIGIKRAYLNPEDFDALYQSFREDAVYRGYFLSVMLTADYGSADYLDSANRVLGGITVGSSNVFNSSKGYFFDMVMMVPYMAAMILLAFAILSLLIALLVLRYAVLSSIEGNFVTLGIFKAVGFTGRQIRRAVTVQYTLVCFVGALCGVLAAIPLIPVVGRLMMDAAGVLWTGGLWLPAGVSVVAFVSGLIGGMTWLGAAKIRKISPVRAISYGRAPVYFAKRLNLPLRHLAGLPLPLRMAVKQMMTRRRQYTLLTVIAVLLTFMATFTGGVATLFEDGENVVYIFGFPKTDAIVSVREISDESLDRLAEIKAEMAEQYEVYDSRVLYPAVDELSSVSATGYERFDGIGMSEPLSGRFPRYDNEVALSPMVAKAIDKGVGDTVTLSLYDFEEEYIVTGIVQCIQEIGKNVTMTTAGIECLSPQFVPNGFSVIFPDGSDKAALLEEMKTLYDDELLSVSTIDTQLSQIIDSVKAVINPAAAISYGLTIVLIALITFLLAMIALTREHTDIGIFKSLGFTARQLRGQFALRFGLVSLIGGGGGLVLALLGRDMLVSMIFGAFGIPRVHMSLGAADLLLPLGLVCLMALLSAWLVSRRVKGISGRTLIVE